MTNQSVSVLRKWVPIVLAVWFCTAMVVLPFYLFVVTPWQIENGYDVKGAGNKWYEAMKKGDGRQAILWAKRAEAYSRTTLRDIIYKDLGNAYELDGQYDVAILYYQLGSFESLEKTLKTRAWPRIYFKQGKKEEAFKAYLDVTLDFKTDSPHRENLYRKFIVEPEYTYKLSPFKDYDDYLSFMEEEYQKLGSPVEYQNIMERIRQLKHSQTP